jgi:outer membrane protein OmpA-like peptidoglycan-associated protein
MRKFVVGMVVLVSAAAGVSACGSKDKGTGEKTPAELTTGVAAHAVEKIADVKTVGVTDSTVTGGGLSETKAPRFTLVLGEGKSGFKFRSAALSDDAKAKIDEMFTGDKFDLKTAHFEIEGYTDNLGSKEVNIQMAIARAKAVKQYLVEEHEFSADSISVVGLGMENPVADNSTPEGRAKNRRVVIKVVD